MSGRNRDQAGRLRLPWPSAHVRPRIWPGRLSAVLQAEWTGIFRKRSCNVNAAALHTLINKVYISGVSRAHGRDRRIVGQLRQCRDGTGAWSDIGGAAPCTYRDYGMRKEFCAILSWRSLKPRGVLCASEAVAWQGRLTLRHQARKMKLATTFIWGTAWGTIAHCSERADRQVALDQVIWLSPSLTMVYGGALTGASP